jgi:hypothetical protein
MISIYFVVSTKTVFSWSRFNPEFLMGFLRWRSCKFDFGFFMSFLRDLSDNKLANIVEDKSTFRNLALPHIRRLNFAANNLKVLHANAFAQFPELERLDLRQNPISSLEAGSFDGISLQQLFMDSRSLHCDCNLKWFVEWLRRSKIEAGNVQVACQTPAKFRGQMLLGIPVESLVCGKFLGFYQIFTICQCFRC